MTKLAVFDDEYTLKRNMLVPVAEQHADKLIILPAKPTDKQAGEWNVVFFAKMDELVAQAGLIN